MAKVFVSYSRKDSGVVFQIASSLKEKGLDVWIDKDDIPKGEKWEQEIYRGIEAADAFLFVLSPDSLASEICGREIDHAVTNKKRIIPILVRDVNLKLVRIEISERNWIYGREGQDDFAVAIDSAIETIHTDYEWARFHSNLQQKALAWERQEDNSRLLRGRELQEIEKQFAETELHKEPVRTELMQRYVLVSRHRSDRQRKTLIAWASLAGVTIAFLLFYRPAGAGFQRWQALAAGNTVTVEPGSVMLGDNVLANQNLALEEQEYHLEGYEIEIYEVTNRRYSRCVSAGVCSPPNGSLDAQRNALKPVAQVTVKQAMTFCEWIDRRLPTEIEWERAARYTDFRPWPWGGDVPPQDYLHAVLNYELLPNDSVLTRDVGDAVEGVSEEGVFDLIGNVWEWTCTPANSSPGDCWIGQAGESVPASFVIRGGGANIPPDPSLVSAYRQTVDWDFNQNRFLGFRCVEVP